MQPFVEFLARWYTPNDGESEKTYRTADEVRGILTAQLAGRLDRQVAIHLADDEYYCPSLADAEEIIAYSGVDRKTYVVERFDCDDFATVLKAHFAQAAYKDGQRRAAHAFGVVWGVIDGGAHAVNWLITDDGVLRFVEPQSDEIYEVDSLEHEVDAVWMLMG